MKKLSIAASAAALMLSHAALAQQAVTTTQTTQTTQTQTTGAPASVATTIPVPTHIGIPASPSYSSTGATAAGTVTTTTVTDTTTVPAGTVKPVPVTAPSVRGHKPGDKHAAQTHTATGADETSDAGDKAAKAVTPLKDSSVPGDGKVEVKGDTLIVH